jgi:hypothetical protein
MLHRCCVSNSLVGKTSKTFFPFSSPQHVCLMTSIPAKLGRDRDLQSFCFRNNLVGKASKTFFFFSAHSANAIQCIENVAA